MTAVILVPRREDRGSRDRVWAWCRSWWERELPGIPIVEGHHTEGPFSRSAALNTASALAGDWDVALVIDADVIADPDTVRNAISRARETGGVVFPFTTRCDLTPSGTNRLVAGKPADPRRFVRQRWSDNVSSVLAIARPLWDRLGGFDEQFVGWGYEDSAFHLAASRLGSVERIAGDVFHLDHIRAKETEAGHDALRDANARRFALYEAAQHDSDALLALTHGGTYTAPPFPEARIPAILHRVVPEQTTPEVEAWWAAFAALHPGWTLMTHRDPLDPADWPLTRDVWPLCDSGARFADLIRLEALARWGGIYVDSDCEPYRPLDALRPLLAFAAWEDRNCVPNAVMGAVPGHPAIREALDLTIARIREGRPTWDSGPGVTTATFVGRRDVLLLPPGAFYPYHWARKGDRGRDHRREQPWSLMAHHWAASWLPPKGKK